MDISRRLSAVDKIVKINIITFFDRVSCRETYLSRSMSGKLHIRHFYLYMCVGKRSGFVRQISNITESSSGKCVVSQYVCDASHRCIQRATFSRTFGVKAATCKRSTVVVDREHCNVLPSTLLVKMDRRQKVSRTTRTGSSA